MSYESEDTPTGQTVVTTVTKEAKPIKKRNYVDRFYKWFTNADKRNERAMKSRVSA